MAVYGYARVSTARQASEGESLEVQQRQIEGYGLMHGLTLDGDRRRGRRERLGPCRGAPGSWPAVRQAAAGDIVSRLSSIAYSDRPLTR